MKKVLFFAGSLFLLAACSKDRSIEAERNEQVNAARFSNSSEPAFNTIRILSSGFSPDSLMANINSNVAWVNDDKDVHTVTSTSGKFDSGDIPPGNMYKHNFDLTGRYEYTCKYHPTRGVVVIAGIR